MKKILSTIFMFLLFPVVVCAQSSLKLGMDLRADGMYLENTSVELVQKIFEDYKYKDFIYMPDWKYPPIFLKRMPLDFNALKDQNLRNKLFLQIMVPLTLRLKEELLIERYELLQVNDHYKKNQKFERGHQEFLDTLAEKYDVFTKFKDDRRYEIFLNNLLLRVDVVPPSILIAAAAAESNWGTAREVLLGNSLYKMKVWYTDDGIKPLDDEDDSYRIKTYSSLYDSITDYAHKLNTDVNFENFRHHRSELRRRHENIRGWTITYNMVVGSPLTNYAGLLNYILTFYDLINIDESTLSSIEIFEEKSE